MRESKRNVRLKWLRDHGSPPLDKTKGVPCGQRPPNQLIWGHSLDDFFWIARIEGILPGAAFDGVECLTIWSRSMVRESKDSGYNDDEHKREPPPRKRKPWPLLKLPKRMNAESRKYGFGVIDPGSDYDSDDDEFKCHTALIDVDSDNEEKTRLLSNRDAFRKLLEKGFNKDWPPGRGQLIQEAVKKGKISIDDGPKLLVFKDIIVYVVRYNTRKPKFIEDRKGKSTAWFADPNMLCIFSIAFMQRRTNSPRSILPGPSQPVRAGRFAHRSIRDQNPSFF
ncbi:uncharacterized protein EI90DRAFT_588482 [Cantharellus anzutake]|uniref:uncharacterized protein n=1 Tax=Cantharellus anzutake TaxID=1750568 RepID=UPI00190693BF|nr:uncharacterized protein EI90DRAFT_588482 [Cantharellus anzutake]KAF8333632.1 hypothetical protein EI90DRAFT_588482 [Cantharellus anzutake]